MSDKVRGSLEAFLASQRVSVVHLAGGGGAAPELAYITPFPRLSIVLAGAHPMTIAGPTGARYVAPGTGEAVFVGAHYWNRPDWSKPATVMAVLVGQRQVGISLIEHTGGGEEPVASAKVSIARPLDDATDRMIAALCALPVPNADPRLNGLVVESLLFALLAQLKRATVPSAGKARQTFEAICLFVQEYAHGTLSRDRVARQFGLSPSHVSRLFRGQGAMRFSDYVNLVRINRAKVLLADPRRTLDQIAADCGYADTAYFCRVFRRFVKMTPTAYRAVRR